MAGDWIPYQKGLAKKQEVATIARLTGKPRRWVVATLLEFWEWCDSESPDGCLGVLLEDMPGLVDETDMVFWQAVVSVGWLRVQASKLSVPHFERWLGNSAKKRLKDSDRKKRVRKLSACEADNNGNPVLFSPVLSSSETSNLEQNGAHHDPPENQPIGRNGFPESAAGCAQAWCGQLTRKKNGYPADQPTDMVPRFEELIRRGHNPSDLLDQIFDKGRSRSEQMFEFENRLERNRNGNNGPGRAMGPSSRIRAPKGKYDGIGKTVSSDPAAS